MIFYYFLPLGRRVSVVHAGGRRVQAHQLLRLRRGAFLLHLCGRAALPAIHHARCSQAYQGKFILIKGLYNNNYRNVEKHIKLASNRPMIHGKFLAPKLCTISAFDRSDRVLTAYNFIVNQPINRTKCIMFHVTFMYYLFPQLPCRCL